MKKLNNTTRNVIVLGVLSGMRANAGVLGTSLLMSKQPGVYFSPSKLVKFFSNKKTLIGLSISAAGEMVGDKLPMTPDRIDPGGLTARVIAGAVCGAAINKVAGKKPIVGAIIGGVAAAGSTFAFFFLRKYAGKLFQIPDPYVGAAEDALAIALGAALVKRNKII